MSSGKWSFSKPFWRTLTYRKKIAGVKRRGVERTPAGACVRKDNILYHIFRGTLSTREKMTKWMASGQDAVFDDLENGGVHRGFHECYASGQRAIMEFLIAKAAPDRTIRITGHRLGGARAMLAAMDIANEKDLVTKIPPPFLGYRHVGVPIVFASPEHVMAHSLNPAYLPALLAARKSNAPS